MFIAPFTIKKKCLWVLYRGRNPESEPPVARKTSFNRKKPSAGPGLQGGTTGWIKKTEQRERESEREKIKHNHKNVNIADLICIIHIYIIQHRPGSVRHESLETRDLQKDRERETHTHKTARKTGYTDNPGEKKNRRRRDEGAEMVVGDEEVGNCPVDHVCAPSSVGL